MYYWYKYYLCVDLPEHSSLHNFFVLPGTSADIMKVGGYKLSALEIESILLEVCFLSSLILHISRFTMFENHFPHGEKKNVLQNKIILTVRRKMWFFQHPVVAECCVLGLPDKDYGDAVSAIIVPEEEAKKKQAEESKPVMSLEELCAWAKDKLAPYKVLLHNHLLLSSTF